MAPQHDETVKGVFAVGGLFMKVSMVLRDQIWIHRLVSEYKNMRMFTRREDAGVEISKIGY